MTTHYVPHRTASGSLYRAWEYVADAGRIVVSVELGARDVTFAVDVCSLDQLVFGACPIVRVDAERWRILPQRVIRRWEKGREILEPLAQPITHSLGAGSSLVLCNTPPDVSAQLEEL